jgi:hypothetical protein
MTESSFSARSLYSLPVTMENIFSNGNVLPNYWLAMDLFVSVGTCVWRDTGSNGLPLTPLSRLSGVMSQYFFRTSCICGKHVLGIKYEYILFFSTKSVWSSHR